MILSPYSNLNIFGGVTGMPFNQNGCNVLDDPRANMIQFGIFGLINMATSYAANHVSSRNVDTPDSTPVSESDLRKQAEATVNAEHPEYETNIKKYTNDLSTATTQCGIWSDALSKLENLEAQKTNYSVAPAGETTDQKATREAQLKNIEGQIETENKKINEAKQKLFSICPSDVNLATCDDPNKVITAITKLLESAKKVKQDAVDEEMKTLKAEQDKITSSMTTPQSRAERQALKLARKEEEKQQREIEKQEEAARKAAEKESKIAWEGLKPLLKQYNNCNTAQKQEIGESIKKYIHDNPVLKDNENAKKVLNQLGLKDK